MVRTLERARIALRRDLTLADLTDRLAGLHGDRPLTEEAGGRALTYNQAAAEVARWSGSIAARTAPGDVVVVAVPNGVDQLLLCAAAARAGTLPAPVNDQMRPEEVDHVIADSGATLVIRSVDDLADGTPPLPEPRVSADPGDVAALFYTSGTTGAPKGVELTHRAIVGQLGGAALYPTPLRRDEAVVALPVAHIMGFIVLVGLAVAGIPTYVLPRFHPVRVLDAIEARRSSVFIGVPAMYRMLEEAGADDRDLTCVRFWGSGADAMPADLAQRFKERGAAVGLPLVNRTLGDATFIEGYGMVEVGGGIAAKMSPGFTTAGKGPLGQALGVPLPGWSVRIVDEAGREVAKGEVGELQVKGPGVLKGYRGDAAATAAVLTDDGWLRTGDLARRGVAGTLVFEGRAKHVVKHGGFSVYAVEVEQALEQHPDVVEAAVIGLPDERLGEIPAAAVRLREGSGATGDEVIAHARECLAEYKVPKRVVVVDELPRTGTTKVRKDALRSLFADAG